MLLQLQLWPPGRKTPAPQQYLHHFLFVAATSPPDGSPPQVLLCSLPLRDHGTRGRQSSRLWPCQDV